MTTNDRKWIPKWRQKNAKFILNATKQYLLTSLQNIKQKGHLKNGSHTKQ